MGQWGEMNEAVAKEICELDGPNEDQISNVSLSRLPPLFSSKKNSHNFTLTLESGPVSTSLRPFVQYVITYVCTCLFLASPVQVAYMQHNVDVTWVNVGVPVDTEPTYVQYSTYDAAHEIVSQGSYLPTRPASLWLLTSARFLLPFVSSLR